MESGVPNDKTTFNSNPGLRGNCFVCCIVVGDFQMSDYSEIIYPQSMTAKLLLNGEVVDEYKIEQCDKCSMLTRFDPFGFQKQYGGEKVIWFCKGCR